MQNGIKKASNISEKALPSSLIWTVLGSREWNWTRFEENFLFFIAPFSQTRIQILCTRRMPSAWTWCELEPGSGGLKRQESHSNISWRLRKDFAYYALGTMHEAGEGMERDYAQAFEIYKYCKEVMNHNGQWKTALWYESGIGEERDTVRAVNTFD